MVPTNFEEAWRFAKIIADSSLAPKNYANKPGDILVAIQMGMELGLQPMQALANIAVVNGRASVWGDAVVAVCMQHPLFGGIEETVEGEGQAAVAACVVTRKGMAPVVRTFSMNDAKVAGLLGKQGPWSQYPRRMLQMRARGFAVRDAFPDALRGLVSQDEAADMEPVKATVVQNTVKRDDAPTHVATIEDPINQKLQREIDNPTPPAIEDGVDPDDFEVQHRGKKTRLGDLGIPHLEYLANSGKTERIRLYANAALAQRIANSPKHPDPEAGPDGWGLSGRDDGHDEMGKP
jgi:hypothetical protein